MRIYSPIALTRRRNPGQWASTCSNELMYFSRSKPTSLWQSPFLRIFPSLMTLWPRHCCSLKEGQSVLHSGLTFKILCNTQVFRQLRHKDTQIVVAQSHSVPEHDRQHERRPHLAVLPVFPICGWSPKRKRPPRVGPVCFITPPHIYTHMMMIHRNSMQQQSCSRERD